MFQCGEGERLQANECDTATSNGANGTGRYAHVRYECVGRGGGKHTLMRLQTLDRNVNLAARLKLRISWLQRYVRTR